jgi:ribosomal-protein-alanine N-acetyltransferase
MKDHTDKSTQLPDKPDVDQYKEIKIFPIMTTDRLILRQFCEADVEAVYCGLSHPDVIKHYGVHYESLSATSEQMSWFKKIEKEETGVWWAICDRHNHALLEAIGFNDWNKENRKIEIGYWLLPDFWGSGIMKEAGKAVCDYAFTAMSVHRIEAVVEIENKNSKKVLSQLGFEFEGIMRDCELKNDRFISLELYAKLNGR